MVLKLPKKRQSGPLAGDSISYLLYLMRWLDVRYNLVVPGAQIRLADTKHLYEFLPSTMQERTDLKLSESRKACMSLSGVR